MNRKYACKINGLPIIFFFKFRNLSLKIKFSPLNTNIFIFIDVNTDNGPPRIGLGK